MSTVKITELDELVGHDLGTSAWTQISQDQISSFAHATGDHQWIHTDPERAATGPYGTTIAHGYLTLSLLPRLLRDVMTVADAAVGINYGIDRIRFTDIVPAGARIRLRARLASSQPKPNGRLIGLDVAVEREGAKKPAMVGSLLLLYLRQDTRTE